MKNSLKKPINIVLKKNLNLKKGEKLLILTDKLRFKLAKAIFDQAKKITNTTLLTMPVGLVHGQEPPKEIAQEMLKYDVEILITTHSLTHTKARRQAIKNSRITTMPGITEDMFIRALNIDYKKLNKLNKKISNILTKGNIVNIKTNLGSNLTFSIKGRKARFLDDGIFLKKGQFGNLPAGESYIAPLETKANGILIIDASIGGLGKVDSPVTLKFKDGKAIEIKGKKTARIWNNTLNKVGPKSRIIAEFGIGTNPKAKIIGNVLEDEKVLGTCHVALGNSKSFGGINDVPLHMDGVLLKPTITVDKKTIMKEGKLLI